MENSHIVSRFDETFDKLKTNILNMGAEVSAQMEKATEALHDYDADAVAALIAADRRINRMNKDIYARAERLIALRQPMALDLRQALSPINIAGELERIGDHAKSTAKRTRRLEGHTPDSESMTIARQMSDMTRDMLGVALHAYADSDIDLAAEVRVRDREVDALNKEVFAKAIVGGQNSPDQMEAYLHVVLLARGFERAGDHVVNIARHVHQIVTGIDLKAAV
ncbi:MAG: phosphate signaling complex protein PhoU [Pikeienuella sp.]